MSKDEENLVITVNVKPGGKVLTILDRMNPLDFGVKVKKLSCTVTNHIHKR